MIFVKRNINKLDDESIKLICFNIHYEGEMIISLPFGVVSVMHGKSIGAR
jgi:hypothetical protein